MKLDRKQDLNFLYQVCFFGPIRKKDGRPDLWLADIFSSSPLKLKNGIRRNVSASSTKFVFFGSMEKKNRRPTRPLIGWDIFDFSFKNRWTEYNELNRKQDLYVLYQVCVFRVDRKTKIQCSRPVFWLTEAFSTSPLKLLNRIKKHLTKSQIPMLCFWVHRNTKMAALSDPSTKVAYSSQVHNIWPFGHLVFIKVYLRYLPDAHVVWT